MSLKKKSIKGFFWDFIGRIGLQTVGFGVSIVLARLLAPEDFGLLAIITVFIGLANVFLDFGFSTALVQRAEIKREHYTAVFYLNISMGLILTILVFLLAPLIGRFYEEQLLVDVTRFMSLSFIVSSFGNVIRARLRREMDFKVVSVTNIAAAIVSGVVALLMALKGFGVWSLAAQSIINQLIANILLFWARPMQLNLKFQLWAIKDLWGFSSKLFFSGLLDTLFINLDSLFIGKLMSPAMLGYYYRAKSLENFTFRYTASTLASVLLPGLSSLQNDPEKLKQTVLKVFHILSFISFLVSGVLLVTGRELIILLFSEKWEPSVILFQIIIAGAFASQIFSLFYNVLLSTGHAKTYLKINVLSKSMMLLNIGMLFFWDIKIYLIFFTLIRILVYYIAMYYSSKLLELKFKLFAISIKQLVIFTFTIVGILVSKNYLSFENLFTDALVIGLAFSISFFTAVYLFNNETHQNVISEIIKPIKIKYLSKIYIGNKINEK